MPEGDTIAYAANRLRPVLVDNRLEVVHSPRNPDWPRRLAGRAVRAVDSHGKHLFIRVEGDLVLHSHLGMVGSWRVGELGPASRRVWLGLRAARRWAVEFDGTVLELMTEGRVRCDRRLSTLGPDVLSPRFDVRSFISRLRGDDPTRPFGDALLDQRNVAGIGNIWKAEGCWEAGIDPWRPLGRVSSHEMESTIEALRPRMLRSAGQGPRAIEPRVYRRTGRPCPRCGQRIRARGQGAANRATYWCPGCQR